MTKLQTQVVTKVRKSICDKTHNLNCDQTQTQIVTKLKNSTLDKTQKLKF